MSLRARQNGGGKIRNAGGRGGGNGSPGGRGNSGGGTPDTWDPAKKGSDATLSNGNLSANAAGNFCRCFSATTKTSGKLYFEILVGTQLNTFGFVGCANSSATATTGNLPTPAMMQRGNGAWSEAGGVNGAAWTGGDVIGFAIDIPNKTMLTYKNGVAQGSITVASMSTSVQICAGNSWGSGNFNFTMRTSTSEFSYSPPSGYIPWANG